MPTSKPWNKESIRELRLRLGWSQHDLARRLNVDCDCVSNFENGVSCALPHQEAVLSLLAQHADSISEEVALTPIAEAILEGQQLPQIDRNSVLESLK